MSKNISFQAGFSRALLIVASVILILVIGGGAGYLWYQNKQSKSATVGEVDTSNWKTYENKEYGFSFKYPEGWVDNDNYKNTNDVKLVLIPKESNNKDNGPIIPQLTLILYSSLHELPTTDGKESNSTSLLDYLKSEKENKNSMIVISDYQEKKVNEILWYKVDEAGVGDVVSYYTEHNNKIIIVSIEAPEYSDQIILSTFQFTPSTD